MPAQSLPFWPHAVAVAAALLALGYATGRVRAPATPPEPTVVVPERRAAPATRAEPAPPEPQVNVPIFELVPGATAGSVEWPESAALATFVLRLPGQQRGDEYALRIREQGGSLVLSAEGLKRSRDATVSIAVPRRFLPRGSYVLELLTPGSKPEGTPLWSYPVEIR